jgi:hypothetical protein
MEYCQYCKNIFKKIKKLLNQDAIENRRKTYERRIKLSNDSEIKK